MPTPVELALTSLLPTTNLLRQELLDLATAFIAQSQSRASTLKPDEEIGRTYACCHVACQRLGKKLSLEIGEPRPPVKPSVYKKLLAYMNSLLRTPAVTPRRGRRVEDKLVGEDNGGKGGRSIAAAATAVTPTTTRRKYIRGATASSQPSAKVEAPLPIMLETDAAGQGEHEEDDNEHEEDMLRPAKRPAKTPLRRKEKHAKRSKDGEDGVSGPAGLLPGLGTMFQPSVDWLSEERRMDYAAWKQGVMEEISMIEAQG